MSARPGLVSLRRFNLAALFVGVLSLTHLAGRLFSVPALVGLGSASGFSPAPKVFSDVNGLETFASNFIMRITRADGSVVDLPITPVLYARLSGPYNRRNVYGAALSYAPRMPEALWKTVFCYGLREGGPLREELGLPDDATSVTVEIRTKTRGRNDTWTLSPAC